MELYTARYILPLTAPSIENGALVVHEGRIAGVGNKSDLVSKFPEAKINDLGSSVILPGLINAHVHLELTNLGPRRSIARLSFPFWLLGLVVGMRIRTERYFRDSINRGLELLKQSGTTTAGHIATLIRNPGELFRSKGLRGVIFLEVIGLKPEEANKIIESVESQINELENDKLVTPAISPHAPYSVSKELFRKSAELSLNKKIPLSLHLSESPDEIKLFKSNRGKFKKIFYPLLGLKKYSPEGGGKTPVKFLNEIGIFGKNVSAVHCVHLHEDDIKILKKSSVSVIHCPRSNYYLNVGKAPLRQLLDTGINICLATDGLVSNGSLSLWDEARFLKEQNPWLDSESILKMMTINPAKALGMEDKIGSLVPGKFADFIAVELSEYEGGNIYEFLITRTTSERIKGVWVGGKRIL